MTSIDETSAPPAYETLPQTPPAPHLKKPVTLRYPGSEGSSSTPAASLAHGNGGIRRAKSIA